MYAELHAKSNFSFLEGASHPDELVARAAELGYAAVAITDRNSLAGAVRAHMAAKEAGIRLIVGAEITPEGSLPLVLWAPDRAAYGRLARLITLGRRRAGKGQCRLTLDDVAQHSAGLLAGVVPRADPLSADTRPPGPVKRLLRPVAEIFGDRAYLLVELHRGPDDPKHVERCLRWSREERLTPVAAGGVHFHIPERRPLHDVLTATRLGCTVAEAGEHLFPNAQRHLKPVEEIRRQFERIPEAVARSVEIAQRCTFSLDALRYEYPVELAPAGQRPMEYLASLARKGARRRYPAGVPAKVRQLVEHELRLIEELHYEAYFLTVWDLVRFARGRGILCQGRGSAANSAVCYCLGITSVDPARMDLLFERFVSRERNEAPDIDVDFEHERREEVLQYLYEKYGRDRAGLTAEVITYRTRSAVRDVGKALGLSLDRVNALAKRIEGFHGEPDLESRCREAGIDPASRLGRQFVILVGQLVGFPRHLSQHTGGMVVTRGPLCELVPIENAAMPNRTVIQWNKDDLDELGILKVDCLALGMLTAIRKAFDLVEKHAGRRLTLAAIPEGDREVYRMISRADTMGVFQVESRAQMSMLPRLRPRCYYDLVIEVAIVRPGPIQGNMVHPYLRRRNGEEPVAFPNEALRQVLGKTLGVPLFQEQAMRLAIVAAGFTPGEADQLRRAMAAWRRQGLIDQFRQKLLDGMARSGYSPEYAESVFRQIRGFGEYGFPESHAASFALLVYVSAWLKYHYHAAFTAAVLNSQPMGFYAPAQLVRDARKHGVEVLPVDVNSSAWDCTLEMGGGVGVGRESGKVLGDAAAQAATLTPGPSPADAGEGSTFFPSPVAGEGGERSEPGEGGRKLQGGQGGWWGEHFGTVEGVTARAATLTPGPSPAGAGEGSTLRLGFRMVRGMSQAEAEAIVRARGDQPFRSVRDFARRTGAGQGLLARLAKAGAMASLERDRRGALWQSLAQDLRPMPLFDHLDEDAPSPSLPAMTPAEGVLADYRASGLSLSAHPMEFLRAELAAMGAVPSRELGVLRNGGPVRVAGIVLVRQRPGTAKGITFMTIEDETGQANLIVRPDVWRVFREAALGATVLLVHGRLQRQREVIHVIASKLTNLTDRLRALAPQSRNFH